MAKGVGGVVQVQQQTGKQQQQQQQFLVLQNKKSLHRRRSSSIRSLSSLVCMSLLLWVLSSSSSSFTSSNVRQIIRNTNVVVAAFTTSSSSNPSILQKQQKQQHQYQYANRYYFQSSSIVLSSSSSSVSSSTSTSSSSSNNNDNNNNKRNNNNNRNNNMNTNTGGLRRLPVVKSPKELIDKAKKSVLYIKPDSEIKNIRNRARKHATFTLDSFTQSLCVPLRDIVKGYKRELGRLHPFECVVADLTIRSRHRLDGVLLKDVLNDIHEGRKLLLETGKDWVAKAKYAPTAKEAGAAMTEGMESLLDLYSQMISSPISDIVSLQKSLRSAPIVELNKPAVVLVGAPNVGKSSIVRTISSGVPEINNYPFTTRGMTMGHVQVLFDSSSNAAVTAAAVEEDDDAAMALSETCQVMDTPGMLVRESDDDRNEMEALTMASMQHLPTAVIYVMDLSGQAGDKFSSVQDQLQLRKEVRQRFPRRPWIDVVSKIDLGMDSEAIEELENILKQEKRLGGYIQLSIHEGIGIDELRTEVIRMLGEVRIVLQAMAAAATTSEAAPSKGEP